jgi:hypothetical protein
MPFEPLQTDEKIEGKPAREKSMDDAMLKGCSGFVGCSMITFALGVWPFLAFGSVDQTGTNVLLGFPIGLIPAAIGGIYVCRKLGLAAACGFIGGAMAIGVFLFLISRRLMLAIFLASGPRQFYSPFAVYLIPVVWVALVVGETYLFLPKSELPFAKP